MITTYPLIIRFVPALSLLTIGLFLSNGLLVELALNWLLLLLFTKKDLAALGFVPEKRRMIHFTAGFALAAFIYSFNIFLQTIFSDSEWLRNETYTLSKFFSASWWTMQSVLYEELIFRGALLYIAITKLGVKKACLLSAVCFGVYHWFSMNAFGNWLFMLGIFLITGCMGYIFALAYAKTSSLYLPIALHFGWNLMNTVIFSQGPIESQLFLAKRGEQFTQIEGFIVMLIQSFLLPVAAFIYIKKLRPSKYPV